MNEELRVLAEKIRKRRRALNLTQQELADMAGCGITFVNQLEMGKLTIRLDKLLSVLKVLGLNLNID